ncbi:hypothetical protein [Leeia sp.]|uniref:hypothetical protein n=1 Tax=Leeia sp. TaxID=2884678 RepID=UPI0035B22990
MSGHTHSHSHTPDRHTARPVPQRARWSVLGASAFQRVLCVLPLLLLLWGGVWWALKGAA